MLLAFLPFCIATAIAVENPVTPTTVSSTTSTAQATEAKPLRDPTVMSPRFREALKNMSPQGTQPAPTGQGNAPAPPAPKMPSIRLLGLISGNSGPPSALLGIGKEQPYLVTSGIEISLPTEDSAGGTTSIEVKSITQSEVKLLIKPFNKMIILR